MTDIKKNLKIKEIKIPSIKDEPIVLTKIPGIDIPQVEYTIQVGGKQKPEEGADVTGTHTAAAITGQGALATLDAIDISSQSNLSSLYPIKLNGDVIEFEHNTTNLKITSNALNTIQDIALSSSPTFAGLTLSGLSDGFVKSASGVLSGGNSIDISGDTNLAASSPIVLTGDTLSLNYNATNLKITSNALNTIQDIATSSSPQFATVRANTAFNHNGNAGLTGTLIIDDGVNWRVTLGFGGGILISQVIGASVAALASWT